MEFLSDDWLDALDAAARARSVPAEDPLSDVSLVIEQVIREGPRWRFVIDAGTLSVDRTATEDEADIRLTSDRHTAATIAAGERAALDAFMSGDLVIGGDISSLLAHREAMEALGDLFAEVRAATSFG